MYMSYTDRQNENEELSNVLTSERLFSTRPSLPWVFMLWRSQHSVRLLKTELCEDCLLSCSPYNTTSSYTFCKQLNNT